MLGKALTCRVGVHGAGRWWQQRGQQQRGAARRQRCQPAPAWGHPAPGPAPLGQAAPGAMHTHAHTPSHHSRAAPEQGSVLQIGRGIGAVPDPGQKLASAGGHHPGNEAAPWLAVRAPALHPRRTRKYG